MSAPENRYASMSFRRCGRSGLLLPAVSLGTWQNFGIPDPFENQRAMLLRAFDLGITHFDTANVYGPPRGGAEETLGRVLRHDLNRYRDELVISTKAGGTMAPDWPGPYGTGGARKTFAASIDRSLKHLGVDYVDILYSHTPDAETPFEETMGALDHIVRQGKALYVGISNYSVEQTRQAAGLLRELGTPCLISQPVYNMFERETETDLLPVLAEEGMGCIVYSPLAQGLLTDRYLKGIPADSRAAHQGRGLRKDDVTEDKRQRASQLREVANGRGQTLPQMALAWVLRQPGVTSALIGASRVEQIEDGIGALSNLDFSGAELARIDAILAESSQG